MEKSNLDSHGFNSLYLPFLQWVLQYSYIFNVDVSCKLGSRSSLVPLELGDRQAVYGQSEVFSCPTPPFIILCAVQPSDINIMPLDIGSNLRQVTVGYVSIDVVKERI